MFFFLLIFVQMELFNSSFFNLRPFLSNLQNYIILFASGQIDKQTTRVALADETVQQHQSKISRCMLLFRVGDFYETFRGCCQPKILE